MKELAIFMKFYETKLCKINHWLSFIQDAIKRKIHVYIWVESNKDLNTLSILYVKQKFWNVWERIIRILINKFKSKKLSNFYKLPFIDSNYVHYITHHNKFDFNFEIWNLERDVYFFMKKNKILHQVNHCQAHFKSCFLLKERFVLHLDADDMYYRWLTVDHIYRLYDYFIKNKLFLLARPYWITINKWWSFWFVLQDNNFIYSLLKKEFRNFYFFCKNNKFLPNLDIFIHYYLFEILKYKYKDVFFYFRDFPYWSNAINVEKFINFKTTKEFCRKYNIVSI